MWFPTKTGSYCLSAETFCVKSEAPTSSQYVRHGQNALKKGEDKEELQNEEEDKL